MGNNIHFYKVMKFSVAIQLLKVPIHFTVSLFINHFLLPTHMLTIIIYNIYMYNIINIYNNRFKRNMEIFKYNFNVLSFNVTDITYHAIRLTANSDNAYENIILK